MQELNTLFDNLRAKVRQGSIVEADVDELHGRVRAVILNELPDAMREWAEQQEREQGGGDFGGEPTSSPATPTGVEPGAGGF